jgi:diaminopimelate epimerase
MRYHNRDGSTGMMCGNGGRCAVRFAIDRGLVGDESDITLVNAGIVYRATVTNRGIRIAFPDPRAFRIGMGIDLLGTPALCHFADVGTPHAIIFVDELRGDPSRHVADVDLQRWGPPLRSHERFGEEGANANFVEVLPGSSTIVLRTFERGVEGETGACGTGAISSAIVASLLRGLTPPVEVITSSGERLWVDFRVTGESITDVTLEGGAEVIGEGELD